MRTAILVLTIMGAVLNVGCGQQKLASSASNQAASSSSTPVYLIGADGNGLIPNVFVQPIVPPYYTLKPQLARPSGQISISPTGYCGSVPLSQTTQMAPPAGLCINGSTVDPSQSFQLYEGQRWIWRCLPPGSNEAWSCNMPAQIRASIAYAEPVCAVNAKTPIYYDANSEATPSAYTRLGASIAQGYMGLSTAGNLSTTLAAGVVQEFVVISGDSIDFNAQEIDLGAFSGPGRPAAGDAINVASHVIRNLDLSSNQTTCVSAQQIDYLQSWGNTAATSATVLKGRSENGIRARAKNLRIFSPIVIIEDMDVEALQTWSPALVILKNSTLQYTMNTINFVLINSKIDTSTTISPATRIDCRGTLKTENGIFSCQ